MKAILGATLIDGTGADPISDSAVLVNDRCISYAGSQKGFSLPDGCETLDASGRFLLPGLVELHAHIYHPDQVKGNGGLVHEPPAYAVLYAYHHLRQALQAGITTVRDAASMDYLDMALKRASAEGLILGPRLYSAGKGICMTGGHGSVLEGFMREADGEEDVRKAVREQIKAGADHIKLLTSHRDETPEFLQEELGAAVDEAHRRGYRVMAHAASYTCTHMAALAGVDTIEHGTFMTDETLDLMVEKGITWVPTCYVYHVLPENCEKWLHNPELPYPLVKANQDGLRWFTHCLEVLPDTFQRALKRGVKIGTGTDNIFYDYPFAAVAEEAGWLVHYGLTPMQAIQSATRLGAEAMGRGDQFGTVQAGKEADLILLKKNPLEDIAALKNVAWVMKAGQEVPVCQEYERTRGNNPWIFNP